MPGMGSVLGGRDVRVKFSGATAQLGVTLGSAAGVVTDNTTGTTFELERSSSITLPANEMWIVRRANTNIAGDVIVATTATVNGGYRIPTNIWDVVGDTSTNTIGTHTYNATVTDCSGETYQAKNTTSSPLPRTSSWSTASRTFAYDAYLSRDSTGTWTSYCVSGESITGDKYTVHRGVVGGVRGD